METRENVKLSTHPYKFGRIFIKMKQKKFFFEEKNSKWPIFQNGRFLKSPILENFSQKFHGWVLGFVGLIDAMALI